jgi:peptidoglycan hydrolase CwlO-like protein
MVWVAISISVTLNAVSAYLFYKYNVESGKLFEELKEKEDECDWMQKNYQELTKEKQQLEEHIQKLYKNFGLAAEINERIKENTEEQYDG